MNYEEKTISGKSIFKGNIIHLDVLNVTLPDGREATREIITHPGATAIVPITDNNEIYMVRQYRKPIEKVTLEIPAGKLDKGELPEVCARRELHEETGVIAGKMEYIVPAHSSPGFSDEVLHLFVATELVKGNPNADEDEFISCEKVPIQKLIEMIFNHEITDLKSIAGILFADRMIREAEKKALADR